MLGDHNDKTDIKVWTSMDVFLEMTNAKVAFAENARTLPTNSGLLAARSIANVKRHGSVY